MNFFKRAFTSITRRLGKSAILLALVFVLGNVIAGAVSIEQSVKNTKNSIMKGMTPVTTVEIDWEKIDYTSMGVDYSTLTQITAEQIERIGALPQVNFFDYQEMGYLQSNTLKRYFIESEGGGGGIIVGRPDFDGSAEYPDNFTLYGGATGEILDRKINKITLAEGREPNADEAGSGKYVAVISKNMAELNKLSVGSVFVMEREIYKWADDGLKPLYRDEHEVYEGTSDAPIEVPLPNEENKPYKVLEFEFTVVGIYETVGEPSKKSDKDYMAAQMEEERQNKIYTTNKAVKNISDVCYIEEKNANPREDDFDYQPESYYTPIFVLKHMEDLESFTKNVASILPEHYAVRDNQGSFDSISAPMKNISSIAAIILYVGVGASFIILSLLITLFLRDRRHEIGIYLSLGEKKLKIAGQVVIEVLLISLVAITLSLFSGNLISGQLSNSMMENQILAQQEAENKQNSGGFYYGNYNTLDYMGYGSDVTLDDLSDQYKVTLGFDIAIFFYAASVITVLLSTLIPMVYVLKLNPKKVLM